METIYITYPHEFERHDLPETVAAIGFFDGVHKGHQSLIKEAVNQARINHKKSAVISFHPHPSVVLKQSLESVQYITTIEEKEALLSQLGVDTLYMITFNKELSQLSPKEFINHFIIGLHIQHLIAGFDFTFGFKGAGNMKNITEYNQDLFTVTEMEKITYDNDKVSSTRIRKELGAGNVTCVKSLLGRAYQATGVVVVGDQRGRQLGFPTANMDISDEKLLPAQGVYAVTIIVSGKEYEGMANLGVKPTFHSDELKPTVEVFIFDFSKDIYGQEITILWHSFIRKEKKFNGINQIVQQLKNDEVEIRNYFRNHNE